MNQREKILAAIVAGGFVLFGGLLGWRAVVTKPVGELDKRITAAREKLEKINAERRSFFAAEDRLKALTLLAFADTIDEASARSGETLTRQILEAGLNEAKFTRLPVGPRKMRGASEIGWNVQGEGPLLRVVNLLFLLEQSPYLQRVENLVLSGGDAPGVVRVQFRCLTLVMTPAPIVERQPLVAKMGLASIERRGLDGIVARDILRPYLKRPPPPPVKNKPSETPAPPPTLAPPGPETFRVVSLSEWQGQPEVHVRDLTNDKTVRYRPGEALAGGVIALVDYRPMPLPGPSGLQSFSRVIIRIRDEFFAIERGQTLADLRKLPTVQIPPQLLPSTVKTP